MRLTEFLELSGLSQAKFGKAIGTTQAAVSRYALGLRFPRRRQLERIRDVTKGAVSALDFLSDKKSSRVRRR